MSAVWMRAKNDLRVRWRGAALLAVVIGLTAAFAMTAAAGARRTATSYQRLLEQTKAFDVEVQLTGDDTENDAQFDTGLELLDAIGRLPQVADRGKIAFIPATRGTPGAPPKPFSWDVSTVAAVDPTVGRTFEIPTVVAGRLADLGAAHEAMVTKEFLDTHDVEVGDEFPLQLVTFDEMIDLFGGRFPIPTAPLVTLEIVGVWRSPHDVSIQEQSGIMWLTPAFYERYSTSIATLESLLVRLRNGERDMRSFTAAARELGGIDAVSIVTQDELVGKVDRALGVQSTALWALAAAIAAGGILVLGQAVGRWLGHGRDDVPTLRALGMGRGLLAATFGVPAAVVAIGAAAAAVVFTILLSPLVPVGIARTVEPEIGIFFDAPVLAVGAGAVLAVVLGRGWLQGVIESRRRRDLEAGRAKPAGAADVLARGGASPAIVTGVRFAVEPGAGRTAVPVRSVIAGTILSIVAVVGAFVFGRSMEHMLGTPATYGWNWDMVVNGGEDPEITSEIERKLVASKHAREVSKVAIRITAFRGADLETLGFERLEGNIVPRILEGRIPTADDEVALASTTMRRAGLKIGDTARFPAAACPDDQPQCTTPFRIVGRVVHWGEGSDPDVGAAFTLPGQARISTTEGFIDFVVRFLPGAKRTQARDAILEELGADGTLPRLPVNIGNVARARSMPVLLSVILAVLTLITMLHALITAARRRRHDLAVLKTLGFLRRQVRAAVAWQSMTTVVLALIVGIPLGIVAGRWTWTSLSDRLGVDAAPVAPVAGLALGSLAVILLAGVVAMGPARIAARTRPAEILRTE